MRFIFGFLLSFVFVIFGLVWLTQVAPAPPETPLTVLPVTEPDPQSETAETTATLQVVETSNASSDAVETEVMPETDIAPTVLQPEPEETAEVVQPEVQDSLSESAEDLVVEPNAPTEQVEVTETVEPESAEPEPLAEEQPVELAARTNLPSIGNDASSGNLIDRRRNNTLALNESDEETIEPFFFESPFRRFATESDGSNLSSIGVILEPEGPIDVDISEISVPVSILVSDVEGDGMDLYRNARANGLEVFVTLPTDHPLAFQTSDGAISNLKSLFNTLPEAIGYAQDPILEIDRRTKSAALATLADLERGYLDFASGLQIGSFGQSGSNIPRGTIALGVSGEVTDLSLTRTLDRAALLAAQSGSTILILPLQRATIEALESFAQSQRGETTAILPVSRVIDP